MFHELLSGSSVWRVLMEADRRLCAEAKARGCACGGRLDQASYERKPRGLPAEIEAVEDYARRLSLCCARCRKRVTPRSVRFLGRRVYVGAVVLLVAVMRLLAVRVIELTARYGPSRRTVERWSGWWRCELPRTKVWRAGLGQFSMPVEESMLPRSLVERFVGDEQARVVAALRFVSPLTTASEHEY